MLWQGCPNPQGSSSLDLCPSDLPSKVEQLSWAGITDRIQVRGLLKSSGFELLHEYGSYDFVPHKVGDELLIVEAAKL